MTDLRVGDTVKHLVHGKGQVVKVEGDRVWVKVAYIPGPAWDYRTDEWKKAMP